MDFENLFEQGRQALQLLDNAKAAVATFRSNVAGGKATLAATELSQIEAQLNEIHAKNLALSAELDDTMSQLQARG